MIKEKNYKFHFIFILGVLIGLIGGIVLTYSYGYLSSHSAGAYFSGYDMIQIYPKVNYNLAGSIETLEHEYGHYLRDAFIPKELFLSEYKKIYKNTMNYSRSYSMPKCNGTDFSCKFRSDWNDYEEDFADMFEDLIEISYSINYGNIPLDRREFFQEHVQHHLNPDYIVYS